MDGDVSRSNNHACGRSCGVCNPHKKWRGNRLINRTTQEQRAAQDDPIANKDLDLTRDELAADPATCRKECCMPDDAKTVCLPVDGLGEDKG